MKNYLIESIQALMGNHTTMVSVVGGGGKTTTIYQLAKAFKTNHSILMTTTTAMFHPRDHVDHLFFGTIPEGDFNQQVVGLFEAYISAKDKMTGIPQDRLKAIQKDRNFDLILNEADGARRKPIKCYAAHEPAIPESSDMVLVVIGADAIGQVLSETIALRLNEFTCVTGLAVGQVITEDTLVKLLTSRDGFLKGIPPKAKAMVIINKVASHPISFDMAPFANRILTASPYDAVIFAEMADFKVLQVYENL